MKKLLFIPMLFAFYMVMGQAINPASIIGKPVRIGNILFAQHDLPNVMKWEDAKKACSALGKGWRLPTKEELHIMFLNKNMIGGFINDNDSSNNTYWSSTIWQNIYNHYLYANITDLREGGNMYELISRTMRARAVKSIS